jgi:dTDP-4-amino-4,6-dideoxygalactose transaminase
LAGLRLVTDPPYGTTNFQSCWLEVGEGYPLNRDGLLVALAEADISARRGIMSTHRQPAYAEADFGNADLSVTEHLSDNTLILPLFHQMSDSEQSRVIDVLQTGAR